MPPAILPFGRLNESTILAEFKSEVVERIERIGTRRFGSFVLPFDTVDMDGEYFISLFPRLMLSEISYHICAWRIAISPACAPQKFNG